jgi:hypothetical protein
VIGVSKLVDTNDGYARIFNVGVDGLQGIHAFYKIENIAPHDVISVKIINGKQTLKKEV